MESWLSGILAASLLTAIVSALTEKSASRTAVRLTCGLLMLLAVLWPLRSFHWQLPSLPTLSDAQLADSQSVLRTETAARAAACVEEQAREAGIDCTATVMLDDALLPIGATLDTDAAADAEALRTLACTVLSLSTEQITVQIEDCP